MALHDDGSPIVDRMSASPRPVQSKRDKRRTLVTDRLNEVMRSFGTNLRQHYEAQTNAVQVDIHLITKANPYQERPLEDDPEEIDTIVYGMIGNVIPAGPVAEDDFVAGAGKLYTEFVHEINNAMEERDVNLTLLANKYATERADLIQRHLFHVQLAQEEHKYLADTLRQRLVSQLSNKRNRLMKEKEQLDLGDSNALLLHPNQFSITNPSSPGGGHKRATRNTGRRGGGGDPDDSGMPQDRRKRKVYNNDDHDGHSPTPAPGGRSGGDGATSGAGGWRDGRPGRNAYHQYEAPTYSVDRLFTDKELMMAMNHASTAATNFLIRNQQPAAAGASNGVPAADAAGGPDDKAAAANDASPGDATPAAAAPDMDRSLSSGGGGGAQTTTHHQTRGATRSAAELAAELQALAARDPRLAPARGSASAALPTYIPAVPGGKANGAPAATAGLASAEAEADLAQFGAAGAEMDWAALGRALDPVAPMEYHFSGPVAGSAKVVSAAATPRDGGGAPAGAAGAALLAVATAAAASASGAGGVPMSKQNSAAGGGEASAPMSRQPSASGVGMRRTASGTGSLLGAGEGGRRVRTRLV